MTGRLGLLAFLAGTATMLHAAPVAVVWSPWVSVVLMVLALLVAGLVCRFRPGLPALAIWCVAAAGSGFLLAYERAELRRSDTLLGTNENQVSRLVVRIAGLPRLDADRRQFLAEVIASRPAGAPETVQISWLAPGWSGPYGGDKSGVSAEFPDLIPGQIWRMAVTLRTPGGLSNPHGFDYEAHVFAQGIRAVGTVRGVPELLGDEAFSGLSIIANRARHHVRAAMLPYVQNRRYGGVLLALTIGDQASISSEDWAIFNRAGLSHAVAISGSHVTMIAALGGLSVLWLWKRVSIRGQSLCERIPAQVAGALAALLVAWLYCLLAGWGVPAQRTFLMLFVVAAAYCIRLPVTPGRLLCAVAVIVVVLDPWALLATGFWLSFAAVAVLMASSGSDGEGGPQPMGRWAQRRAALLTAVRLQLAITSALAPFLAVLFHDVSIASPLVNAYALPVIGLWVTPLSLLLGLVAPVPGLGWLALALAWLAHTPLELAMMPTVWIASSSLASVAVAAAPAGLVLLAVAGVVLAIHLHGLPGRQGAWLLMLPMLVWQPARPVYGGWDLHALDVGQGSAVVVQTARHALVFDTGPRSGPASDAGQSVLLPFLRARGIRTIDALVLSHADLDHVGGAASLLSGLPVTDVYASFDLQHFLTREAGLLSVPVAPMPAWKAACEYGLRWHVDGVVFSFLWPVNTASMPGLRSDTDSAPGQLPDRNAGSCVLHVQGRFHSALLPGDIGHIQERTLVKRGLAPVDLVLAGHHGSKTSSDKLFVEAVAAQHVIVQAGHANRYGHPHAEVRHRWHQAGSRLWRTDLQGAVRALSDHEGLHVTAHRIERQRHWQRPLDGLSVQ